MAFMSMTYKYKIRLKCHFSPSACGRVYPYPYVNPIGPPDILGQLAVCRLLSYFVYIKTERVLACFNYLVTAAFRYGLTEI